MCTREYCVCVWLYGSLHTKRLLTYMNMRGRAAEVPAQGAGAGDGAHPHSGEAQAVAAEWRRHIHIGLRAINLGPESDANGVARFDAQSVHG